MLHPCRTAEVMALLRSASKLSEASAQICEDEPDVQGQSLEAMQLEEDMQAYFVAWFSVYGSLLGLALPRSLWPNAKRVEG